MEFISCLKYSVTSSNVSRGGDNDNSINIVIAKSVALENYNIAFEISNAPYDGKWVIEPQKREQIGYMAFMLNDPIMLKRIFGENKFRDKKYRVTKSMISSLPIPAIDDSISVYYSLIELIFQEIYFKQDKDDIGLLKLDIIASIRLALSFELHQFKILRQFNILIYENWKTLVDKFGNNFNMIFEELLKPDNALINNVRRFQILLGSLEKTINDGLEIK